MDADGIATEVQGKATKVKRRNLKYEPALGTKMTGRAEDQLMRAVYGG